MKSSGQENSLMLLEESLVDLSDSQIKREPYTSAFGRARPRILPCLRKITFLCMQGVTCVCNYLRLTRMKEPQLLPSTCLFFVSTGWMRGINVCSINEKLDISFLLLLYTGGKYTILGNSGSKTALLIKEVFLKDIRLKLFSFINPSAR